eukprot:ANDGO_05037.mRNA.1 hypothetical protein
MSMRPKVHFLNGSLDVGSRWWVLLGLFLRIAGFWTIPSLSLVPYASYASPVERFLFSTTTSDLLNPPCTLLWAVIDVLASFILSRSPPKSTSHYRYILIVCMLNPLQWVAVLAHSPVTILFLLISLFLYASARSLEACSVSCCALVLVVCPEKLFLAPAMLALNAKAGIKSSSTWLALMTGLAVSCILGGIPPVVRLEPSLHPTWYMVTQSSVVFHPLFRWFSYLSPLFVSYFVVRKFGSFDPLFSLVLSCWTGLGLSASSVLPDVGLTVALTAIFIPQLVTRVRFPFTLLFFLLILMFLAPLLYTLVLFESINFNYLFYLSTAFSFFVALASSELAEAKLAMRRSASSQQQ